MNSKKLIFSLMALALFIALTTKVKADPITLNMNATGFASPNSVISFQGILSNQGAPAVFLNGLSFTVPSGLTFNPLPFFSLPAALAPGQSTSLSTLFTISIGSISPGSYIGSFTILGGATSASLNSLLTRDFQVNVVPEPGTLLLVGTALAGLFVRKRAKRK